MEEILDGCDHGVMVLNESLYRSVLSCCRSLVQAAAARDRRRLPQRHRSGPFGVARMGDTDGEGGKGVYHLLTQQEMDERAISAPPVLEFTAKVSAQRVLLRANQRANAHGTECSRSIRICGMRGRSQMILLPSF